MQLKEQPQVVFCDLYTLATSFDILVYSKEAVVKHEHYLAICFEIHRSVQAPFHGAGVVESTIM
jgi:hypothetical protein